MDTKIIDRRTKIEKALLLYEPGPGVENRSDYKVYFFSDMTISYVKYKKASAALRNIWRMYKPTEQYDLDDSDWLAHPWIILKKQI